MNLSLPHRRIVAAVSRLYSLRLFLWLLIFFITTCSTAFPQSLTENPYSTAYRNSFGKLPKQPTAGDWMFANWVKSETELLSGKWSDFSKQLKDWDSQQEVYRQQLRDMLGLDPLPEKTDLKATVTNVLTHPEFTVENLHFQSRPGLYCTANVYVPKNINGRVPAVLYLCGHGAVKENGISYGNKTHYQHHGAWFARNGYVCMVLDSVQLGEIEGKHHGTHHLDMWWWNSRGFSAAGPEAWNCVRALDYLQSRADVDPDKLGVTGRSGGGAYSWWIAALDTRIKAACPVAGITDLQNHCVDGCVEGHCDCMYMVNSFRWDYSMVAALVAPRPLLICNTDKDSIFPLDGVVRLHGNVRRFYDHFGSPDKLGIAITEGGHVDTQELQMPVMRWFNKWLKNSNAPVNNFAEKYFTVKELKVLAAIPEDEITSRCYENFTTLATNDKPHSPESIVEELRSKTFGAWPWMPSEIEVPIPRVLSEKVLGKVRLTVYKCASQADINLRLYVLQPDDNKPIKNVTFAIQDAAGFDENLNFLCNGFDEILKDEAALLKNTQEKISNFEKGISELSDRNEAIVLCVPRGVGLTALGGDAKYQTQVRRRLMLLGSTMASGQVYDCIRALDLVRSLESFKSAKFKMVAEPEMTEVGCFAVLMGAKVDSLELKFAPRADQQAADFLNWSRIVTPEQLLKLVQEKASTVVLNVKQPSPKLPE